MKRVVLIMSAFALALMFAACSSDSKTDEDSLSQFGVTLQKIKERGKLVCGVSTGLPGFTNKNGETYSGFDVDFCKALAAAIFGDATKVEYRGLTAAQRFDTLKNKEIDVLIRNTTWTLSRDTELGGNFVATTFYDGQGFMVLKSLGATKLEDLDGKKICLIEGTTGVKNVADAFASRNITHTAVTLPDNDAIIAAYDKGDCDAIATDRSGLVGLRSNLTTPADHEILAETISKEPLGPMVRHGDDQWFDIVQWVVFATLIGEEHGISMANVDQMKSSSTDAEVKRLLGVDSGLGTKLGLGDDWAYNVLKMVGNYAEIYDRNLGPSTTTSIPRGLNTLWTDGGLLYAPPYR